MGTLTGISLKLLLLNKLLIRTLCRKTNCRSLRWWRAEATSVVSSFCHFTAAHNICTSALSP